MLSQSNANATGRVIFALWDHIDSISRHGSFYDFTQGEAGKWQRVDKSFVDGLRHAVTILSCSLVHDPDEELDTEAFHAAADAKLEELREEWEQYQIAKSECAAELRNAEATYGTMW